MTGFPAPSEKSTPSSAPLWSPTATPSSSLGEQNSPAPPGANSHHSNGPTGSLPNNPLTPRGKSYKRHFPDWLSAYLQYTNNTEAPLDFHLWTGIATLSSICERHVGIEMGFFQGFANFSSSFVAHLALLTNPPRFALERTL